MHIYRVTQKFSYCLISKLKLKSLEIFIRFLFWWIKALVLKWAKSRQRNKRIGTLILSEKIFFSKHVHKTSQNFWSFVCTKAIKLKKTIASLSRKKEYDLNVEVIFIDFVCSIWIVTLVQFGTFVFGMEQAINAKIRCFEFKINIKLNLKIVLFAEQSKCFPVCFSSRRKRQGSLVFETMFKIIQFGFVNVVGEKNKTECMKTFGSPCICNIYSNWSDPAADIDIDIDREL